MGVIQSLFGRSAGGSDPFWANVVSLLWFNGNLTDQRGKTYSASNGAAVSSVQSKFGGQSLRFNGLAPALEVAKDADFDFPGQFCIDFWLYVVDFGSGFGVREYGGTNNGAIEVRISSPGNIVVNQYGAGNIVNAFGSIPLNTWTHIAVSRDGSNSLRIFKDGVNVSGTVTSANFSSTGTPVYFGLSSGTEDFYIDDLRITKGAARYTSNFAPPTFQAPNS